MPLNLDKLTRSLIAIDSASSPKTGVEAAVAWTNAFVDFSRDMTYLLPGSLELGRPVFLAAMQVAFLPISTWPVMCAAIEVGFRAFWPIVANPAFTIPTGGTYTPSPIPLTPLLLPVPIAGILSPTNVIPRTAIAAIVYTWNLTNTIIPLAGPLPVPFL